MINDKESMIIDQVRIEHRVGRVLKRGSGIFKTF